MSVRKAGNAPHRHHHAHMSDGGDVEVGAAGALIDAPPRGIIAAKETGMSKAVAELVARMARYFVESGRAGSAYEINCGSCADFAEAITYAIVEVKPVPPCNEVWVDDWLVGEAEDENRDRVDREKIATNFPELTLPEDLTWDDFDEISRDYNFAGGSHVWVQVEDRHYDAEATDGVTNPLDLPYFQRVLSDFRLKRGEQAVPLRL